MDLKTGDILICSELVYILLKKLGKIDSSTDLIDATPNKLYRYLTLNFCNKGGGIK